MQANHKEFLLDNLFIYILEQQGVCSLSIVYIVLKLMVRSLMWEIKS